MTHPPQALSRVLVRHAAVAARYDGICYGRSDVELSHAGKVHSQRVAEALAEELTATGPVARIVHSGMQRTQFLAELLGERLGLPAEACDALRERDFGRWELKSWDEIFEQHGDAMLGMLSRPATYRPGGGETTDELCERVLRWWEALPRHGLTVAVTHGGPIAVLRGTHAGLPVSAWPKLVPACGQCVRLEPPVDLSQVVCTSPGPPVDLQRPVAGRNAASPPPTVNLNCDRPPRFEDRKGSQQS